MKLPHFSLASQILAFQLGIVLAAVAVGAAASVWQAGNQLDQRYKERSLSMAQAVAAMPEVRAGLQRPDPSVTLQPLVEPIRQASGALFIVIADRNGIRQSHPNPDLIGKTVNDNPQEASSAKEVMSGRTWVGVETGSLRRSVRGKAPIRDADGQVIGIVSVGFLEEKVVGQVAQELPLIVTYLLVAFGFGLMGSLLLARRLKRQTFGLEPREIAALLEQREASLHGIREGTLATDGQGRISLLNEEARRLLDLPEDAVGKRIEEVVPSGRMRSVLTGTAKGTDQVVLASDRVLVANRRPVMVRGEAIGSVVTLRDRTELESLVRELDDARSLTEVLRAQAHEFSNRLHTIAGLIELGRHEEAILLSTEASRVSQELTESLLERVGDPMLGALLLTKAALAAERGIEFRISADTHLEGDGREPRDLITVVGNLIENAFDAVFAPGRTERLVEVSIRSEPGGVHVYVHDTGPGVPAEAQAEIFTEGFTTKATKRQGSPRRGLGLALVKQVVDRCGGEVSVDNDEGAVFRVRLPRTVPVEVAP